MTYVLTAFAAVYFLIFAIFHPLRAVRMLREVRAEAEEFEAEQPPAAVEHRMAAE